MNRIVSVLIISGAVFLLTSSSCSSNKKPQNQTPEVNQVVQNTGVAEHTIVPDTFVLPVIPEVITNTDERAKYLIKHYWDRFDFANRELINRPDITEQAFVDYINLLNYVPEENADESLKNTVNKAETDTVMLQHFAVLFEKYFYDPNSPFRNEEYYIPVLQELVESSVLTSDIKSIYQFHLNMVMMNRVGQKANNFSYTLESGQSFKLYDLQSEFTLLMFSNPGCSTCEMVINQLVASKPISDALSMNSSSRTMLTILTIYPDDDLASWHSHLSEMPANWVHGYDRGMEITQERLYDIKAFPTIYLLDKDKKVIQKDTSIEALEAFFSIQ